MKSLLSGWLWRPGGDETGVPPLQIDKTEAVLFKLMHMLEKNRIIIQNMIF
jgi:hypothetical protein